MTSIISTETLTRREPASPKTAKSEAPEGAKGFDAAMDDAQDTTRKAHTDTDAARPDQGQASETATKPTEPETPDTEKRLRSLMAFREAAPDMEPDAPDAANPDDAQDVAVDAVLLTVLEPTADAPVALPAPIAAVAAHSDPQDTLPLATPATAAATMLDTEILPTPVATPSAPGPLATTGTEPKIPMAMTDTTITTPEITPNTVPSDPVESRLPTFEPTLPKAETAIDLGLIPAADTAAAGIGTGAGPAPVQFAQVQGTTAPTLNTTVPTWHSGMVEHITQRVKDGVQEFEINLAPEKLGHVSIKIDLRGDAANITIVTQTADAQKLFNDNQDRLSAMFAQAGLELGQHSTQSQGQGGAGAERGGNGQSQTSDTDRAPDPTTAPRRSAGSATLVDLVA